MSFIKYTFLEKYNAGRDRDHRRTAEDLTVKELQNELQNFNDWVFKNKGLISNESIHAFKNALHTLISLKDGVVCNEAEERAAYATLNKEGFFSKQQQKDGGKHSHQKGGRHP